MSLLYLKIILRDPPYSVEEARCVGKFQRTKPDGHAHKEHLSLLYRNKSRYT